MERSGSPRALETMPGSGGVTDNWKVHRDGPGRTFPLFSSFGVYFNFLVKFVSENSSTLFS